MLLQEKDHQVLLLVKVAAAAHGLCADVPYMRDAYMLMVWCIAMVTTGVPRAGCP